MNRFSKFAASALALSLVPAMLMGCGKKETAASSDLDYIKQKGTLVVGITDFAPMDYQDADGSWIGFGRRPCKGLCRVPRRGGPVPDHRMGQQGHGAGRQDHRRRLERHDADGRGHILHGVLECLLQQRTGRHSSGRQGRGLRHGRLAERTALRRGIRARPVWRRPRKRA